MKIFIFKNNFRPKKSFQRAHFERSEKCTFVNHAKFVLHPFLFNTTFLSNICLHLPRFWFLPVKSAKLKGNRVQISNYSRSCKLVLTVWKSVKSYFQHSSNTFYLRYFELMNPIILSYKTLTINVLKIHHSSFIIHHSKKSLLIFSTGRR